MILALKRAKMSSKMPKKARKAEKSQIVSNDSILPPNIIIRSKKLPNPNPLIYHHSTGSKECEVWKSKEEELARNYSYG